MPLEDVWRKLGERISFNTRWTCKDIPDTPGVYAWFLPLWIYDDDLTNFISKVHGVSLHDSDQRVSDATGRNANS